jgi:hypothetical protein
MPTIVERLDQHERELDWLSMRFARACSFERQLSETTRDKPFTIHNETAWLLMLAERDKIVIDLASWAKAFYSPGGFLCALQGPDFAALQRGPKSSKPTNPNELYVWTLNVKGREEWFDRLFPTAATAARTTPNMQDVAALRDRLSADVAPLLADRNQNRAHFYEQATRKTAGAKMLNFLEQRAHFEFCRELVHDLRLLADNTSYGFVSLDPRDDHQVRDMVDLLLTGTLDFTVRSWNEHASAGEYLWQRRAAYYKALHEARDTAGAAETPTFNDRRL